MSRLARGEPLAERMFGRIERPEPEGSREDPRRLPLRWNGVAFNYSGYARVTRELLPPLARRGMPVDLQTHDVDEGFVAAMNARPEEVRLWNRMTERRNDRGVQLTFHPARTLEGVDVFALTRARNPGFDSYLGYTMFETDRLPRGWIESCRKLDRLLVPSTFCRDVFAARGMPEERIRVLPHGLDWAPYAAARPMKVIDDRPGFLFLSVFEWMPRKGWDVLLDAWCRAFDRRDDVALVVRAYRRGRDGAYVRRRIDEHLRSRGIDPAEAPRIEVLDRFVPESEMPALYAGVDAFVLPTRGEGWGLPLMEAMGSGLPTIGTRWSGQLDFMHDGNSFLVDVEGLEAVAPEQTAECGFYEADHLWARPSIEHCAELMRRVYDDRAEAARRATVARTEMRRDWTSERVAELMIDHVREALEDGMTARRAHRLRRGDAGFARLAWSGPARDRSGHAEEARGYLAGLDAIGMPVRLLPVELDREEAALEPRLAVRMAAMEATPLADRFVSVQHLLGNQIRPLPSGCVQVARTMFEADGLPPGWIRLLERMDEVWVPSAFNLDTFRRSGLSTPLRRIPEAIDRRLWDRKVEPLEIPERRSFNFLSVFDWSRRKGWEILIDAWLEAFDASDDVALVLKVRSSHGRSIESLGRELESHVRARSGRSLEDGADVVLLDRSIPCATMPGLYAAADAFVLPSRGEGWGRPLMEAMAAGLPTIGTAWSGNTEFMDDTNSFLVGHDLVPVDAAAVEEAPFFRGQRWAEPRRGDLVEALRRVHRGGAEVRRRADRGRRSVLERFDLPLVAEEIRRAVEVLLARPRRG